MRAEVRNITSELLKFTWYALQEIGNSFFAGFGVKIQIGPTRSPSIDKRLQRLDVARAAMQETLEALDELREEADNTLAQHNAARTRLLRTLNSQFTAEAKLAAVKDAMRADVGAFQTLAGFNPGKERFIGFWSGVAASTLVGVVSWAIGQREAIAEFVLGMVR